MKVIKQRQLYPLQVKWHNSYTIMLKQSNVLGEDATIFIEREKLKSLIEFLQKEVEKNEATAKDRI